MERDGAVGAHGASLGPLGVSFLGFLTMRGRFPKAIPLSERSASYHPSRRWHSHTVRRDAVGATYFRGVLADRLCEWTRMMIPSLRGCT